MVVFGDLIFCHYGLPGYRHDWQWPPEGPMLWGWFLSKLDPWNWTATGVASPAVQVHPLYLLAGLLGLALGSKWSLATIIIIGAAVAAGGIARIASELNVASELACFAAGVMYSLAPVVFNEYNAGHIPYLIAYDFTPVVILEVLRRKPWRTAFAFAIVSVQIQVLVIVALFILPLVRYTRAMVLAFVVVLLTLLPYLWSLLRPASAGEIMNMHTTIPWEYSQSIDLTSALQGTGYFARYWEQAVTGTLASYGGWIYAGMVAICAITAWSRRTLYLISVYVFGVLLLWGMKGLAAPILGWLFEHVAAASALRELYDAAILITFPASLCAAIAISRAPYRMRVIIVVIIAAAVSTPFILPKAQHLLGTVPQSRELRHIEKILASNKTPTEFFLSPGANPDGPLRQNFGGADPLSYRIGAVMPFWAYLPTPEQASLIWAMAKGGALASSEAQLFGISYILEQQDIALKSASLIPYRVNFTVPTLVGVPSSYPKGWKLAYSGRRYALLAAPKVNSLVRLSRAFNVSPSSPAVKLFATHGVHITEGWAPATDWWFLSAGLALGAAHGVVTSSRSVPLNFRCLASSSRVSVMVLGSGRIEKSEINSRTWTMRSIPCHGQVVVQAKVGHFIAITDPADIRFNRDIARIARNVKSYSLIAQRIRGDTIDAVSGADCKLCQLTLAETHDSDWKLVTFPSTTVKAVRSADDETNSWLVSLRRGDRINITYVDPVAQITAISAGAAWGVLFLAAFADLSFLRRARKNRGARPPER
ncbi:MAG: hypothetical protein ACYCUI_09820 [Vulcanimicrobiaceae bacterium]